jgi:hypothetical protein
VQTIRDPALYELNIRVRLTELADALGRPATLDDFPDRDLDDLARAGFDWIWLLSVWHTGEASRAISRSDPGLRREFEQTLGDLREEDIAGSGFAIVGYSVDPSLGGDAALARLRERMRRRGLRLMLDFIANHTAPDHPWIASHPEYYVSEGGAIACGKDPFLPAWTDTRQLDYSNAGTIEAMTAEMLSVAARCDGVRCDMAMLLLPDVFERTWGRRALPFWPDAIGRVRRAAPGFCFMAEVYWDLEWTLQQLGFDYTYDKRLYDRLRDGRAAPVRDHLRAGLDFQERLARFLENHDEPRAAVVFEPPVHAAAAVITYLTPGLRLFHHGQLEGRRARISPHLVRAPIEPVDAAQRDFYERLLTVLREPVFRAGTWRLLDCAPAWTGNWTHDCCLAWMWTDDTARRLVAVNYAGNQSQCFVRGIVDVAAPGTVRFTDHMSPVVYDRDSTDLATRGLYLDLPPWAHHVFAIS